MCLGFGPVVPQQVVVQKRMAPGATVFVARVFICDLIRLNRTAFFEVGARPCDFAVRNTERLYNRAIYDRTLVESAPLDLTSQTVKTTAVHISGVVTFAFVRRRCIGCMP